MVPSPTAPSTIELALELAGLERPAWRARLAAIPAWHPRNDGDDDDQDDTGDDDDKDADADEGEKDDKDEQGGKPEDWKAQSRKHEREAKRLRKENEALAKAAKDRETESLSEQEKALAKARDEAKTEVLSEVEQERRHDRLEVQVTRLASKTFADTEDALIHIERAIAKGEIDADDIFDSDGKVQTDALRSELEQLLERKQHLAAKAPGPGDSDAGKGSGGADVPKGPAAHLKHIQNRK
jgi:hypothetical protein